MKSRVKIVFARFAEDQDIIKALVVALGSVLVAGTLPELLKLIPGKNLTLGIIFVIGLVVLAAGWLSINGRHGVGIAVYLPPSPDSGWSEDRVLNAAESARRQHVSFFYINVDELLPGLVGADRVRLVQRVINSRLREEGDRSTSRIFCYLTCSLDSAFDLGRRIFGDHDPQTQVVTFREVVVQQVSAVGAANQLPSLLLRRGQNGLQTTREAYPLDALLARRTRNLSPQSSEQVANRHALIIRISDVPDMVEQAVAAAGSGPAAGTRYEVSNDDICATALILECSASLFPNKQAAYNELLRSIVRDWELFVDAQRNIYGGTPEGRLFIAAPSSLAFALGALLPSSVKVVSRQ